MFLDRFGLDHKVRLLRFAIEGRKRIKDQLFRIDTSYSPVRFTYFLQNGVEEHVKTLEEEQYPRIC